MNSMSRWLLGVLSVGCLSSFAASPGDARIAKWKDDRTAAFLLMFDDSWPSHFQVAAPELAKRGMIATFYINPGKGEYQKFAKEWEQNLWRQGMVYGNHTMTHKGVHDMDEAEKEIGGCARVIRGIMKWPETKLVSYGQPGVGPNDWKIDAAQLDGLLKKHHLISRPDFAGHGAVYHLKTCAEILALADKAIATTGMNYVVFHGVERIVPDWKYQDFWAFKQSEFLPLLDALKERSERGDLWITDHISQHQYATERDAATVRTLEATPQRIRLELTCTADPVAYDLPLTVVVSVPAGWKDVVVEQGGQRRTVLAQNGSIRFDAKPGTIDISGR